MTDRPNNLPAELATGDGASGPLPASSSAGKPKRKPIPLKKQIDVLLHAQTVLCPLCGSPLRAGTPRILEHMTPHATRTALGLDPDAIDNLRFVHSECAARKTNGTKATVADGDLHKIAKAKRLDKAREAHRAVLAGETTRAPGKIKSRGFQKVHRPMRRPT